MRHRIVVAVLALAAAATAAVGAVSTAPEPTQLEAVRSRIRSLEGEVQRLDAQRASARAEREGLNAELALAEARVEELELVLTRSRDEASTLQQELERMATELAARKKLLQRHLEMLALLGRPGPVQMLADAVAGGEVDEAVATVAVLTAAQVRLMEEYAELRRERNSRLAELSLTLEGARREADELLRRRHDLENVRQRVEARLGELERSRRSTGSRLDELREREQALERLMERLAARDRFTGREDIRRYRGALPWPAEGKVMQGFGRHYLPKYATYTVCNGVRMAVDSGAEVKAVFSGVVAYASHFKGYGNMVVIDHGNDVYSLVAGLATIHVRLNQSVSMGLRLGLASPPSDEGNLYFEIRVGETAQDPRRWLLLPEG